MDSTFFFSLSFSLIQTQWINLLYHYLYCIYYSSQTLHRSLVIHMLLRSKDIRIKGIFIQNSFRSAWVCESGVFKCVDRRRSKFGRCNFSRLDLSIKNNSQWRKDESKPAFYKKLIFGRIFTERSSVNITIIFQQTYTTNKRIQFNQKSRMWRKKKWPKRCYIASYLYSCI